MDFIDRINELAARVPKQLDYCSTEEATKNALVLPFLNALGYDVFNPTEVLPEYTADVGIKKGEKVDYAILQNGTPIMLFECKLSGADLGEAHMSQLYRYFHAVPDVRFAVLTNGVAYWFYADLDKPNVMDERPFFCFNLLDFQPRDIDELKKFTKSTFDVDHILETASDLKYTAAITALITQEFEQPSEDLVVFLSRQVFPGRMTQSVREQFSEIVRKALKRFLSEQINQRLQSAMEDAAPEATAVSSATEDPAEDDEAPAMRRDRKRGIVTTEDEIEGFFAVKSILRGVIDHGRVHIRDTKSYCGILLDNNNRKPICRLHFNGETKYLGLFDADKDEERVAIAGADEIYRYAARIVATVRAYDVVAVPAARHVREKSGVLLERSATYTGRQVVAVHLEGRRHAVANWRAALLAVLSLLHERRPAQFEQQAPQMVGRIRPYITTDPTALRSSEPIPGTPFYVETNLSSQMIVRLCYRMAAALGVSESELAFEAT